MIVQLVDSTRKLKWAHVLAQTIRKRGVSAAAAVARPESLSGAIVVLNK
jgi:hypothetical protein